MPGGIGNFEELFEAVTLVQTKKVTQFPIVLAGVDYWSGLVAWLRSPVLAEGKIDPDDVTDLMVTDDVDEAVELITRGCPGPNPGPSGPR